MRSTAASRSPGSTAAGEDAVMFSIDYPYEDTAAAVASIEKADLTPGAKDKVTRLNAQRVLGLAEEEGLA
jgi:predicted TIM-barrel fold metal-dependent hydrolase